MSPKQNPTSADLRAEAIASAFTAWSRVAEWLWRNSVRLGTLPLELASAEDRALGVWRTSVPFPRSAPHQRRVRCSSVRRLPAGQLVRVAIEPFVAPFPLDPDLVQVDLELPRRAGAGFYEITLTDGVDTRHYKHYFGLPGQAS